MKLLICRHGDPDYEKDSLTSRGWKEAEALANRLANEKIDYFYVSPLGRAKDTASKTLEKFNKEAITKDWLREFHVEIIRPDRDFVQGYCWDWMPKDWANRPNFYLQDKWYEEPEMKKGNAKEEYVRVTKEFDNLLLEHGYKHIDNLNLFESIKPNHDTICLFCHFGVESVLLSHLIGCSPMLFWHGFCAAPTSVTTVYTEEPQKGYASFRIAEFGSTEHLYVKGIKPSFMARRVECAGDIFEYDD